MNQGMMRSTTTTSQRNSDEIFSSVDLGAFTRYKCKLPFKGAIKEGFLHCQNAF